jgi:hypothetical protein
MFYYLNITTLEEPYSWWDVIQGILVYTLKLLHIAKFLHHVKCPTKMILATKYDKLLLEAHLNCDANHQAGSSPTTYTRPRRRSWTM